MKRYVCIHGHFYQPPRENPWLEVVEVQDSASPFHDWNARVAAECYAPNAAARILDQRGAIVRIQNNYSLISFNFGPTLLTWLEEHDPETYQALLAADRESLAARGRGNAVAQVYNHIIMPLAPPRDRLTEVRWGIRDFRRRFGRAPEGMWLAETAVDRGTLEDLAAEGIAYTILAPRQCSRIRPPGGQWRQIDHGMDSRRPYRVRLPSGRELTVFFYHGGLSQAVAFENLLEDGGAFARRILEAFDPDPEEPQLVMLATDGESYGHHHRFGEMALAFCLDRLAQDPSVEITNPAAFLAAHPPTWEAEVVEDSSWSCAHGVERWRSDCGCALDPGRGWSQAWRAPLRQALDGLGSRLSQLFLQQGPELFKDPWAARDDYVATLGGDPELSFEEFLARHQARELDPAQKVRAAKLLEAMRWGLYMFTSCAWFFDDIAGIEAVQNLRFAARALQLASELDGGGWEEEVLSVLAGARSNQPREGDGRQIWQTRVAPARVGPRRVVAHAAISGVMGDEPPPARLYCYYLRTAEHHHRHNLGLHLAWGRMQVSHRRIGQEQDYRFGALYAGGHDFQAWVAPADRAGDLSDLGRLVEQPLRLLERGALAALFDERLNGTAYSLGDLFLEGRRTLARAVLDATLSGYKETVRGIYESGHRTMAYLKSISVPPPRVYLAVAEAILADDLAVLVKHSEPGPLPDTVGQTLQRARELGVSLASPGLARVLEAALVRDLERLAAGREEEGSLRHAGQVLDVAEALDLKLDLWRAQNLFHHLREARGPRSLGETVLALGRRLRFAL